MVYEFFEELKNIVKEKIKGFYSKFKYILLVVSLIALIFSILLFDKKNPIKVENIENQQIFLLGISIDNWLQWITIITIPYTAGWAIYQYKKSVYIKQQEKATNIAKEFSEDVINKCGLLYLVYSSSSLNDLLKFDEKNYDDFKFFNVDELRKIYKDDNFPTEYSKKRTELEPELDKIYHRLLEISVTPYNDIPKEILIKKGNKVKKITLSKNPFVLQNSNLPYHFNELESDILNKLEYICMDISSKATDSSFIYQSLHQMFLRTVRTLAVSMSIDNNNFSDKYYTNIIHVYNDWTSRYEKDIKKEKRKKEKINKILNPKIKTV